MTPPPSRCASTPPSGPKYCLHTSMYNNRRRELFLTLTALNVSSFRTHNLQLFLVVTVYSLCQSAGTYLYFHQDGGSHVWKPLGHIYSPSQAKTGRTHACWSGIERCKRMRIWAVSSLLLCSVSHMHTHTKKHTQWQSKVNGRGSITPWQEKH